MIEDGEDLHVFPAREENVKLWVELKKKDEEIALLKAHLQKLQPPKEGVPPV